MARQSGPAGLEVQGETQGYRGSGPEIPQEKGECTPLT